MPRSVPLSPVELSELIRLARTCGISELTIQRGVRRVLIRMEGPSLAEVPAADSVVDLTSERVFVKSPMTGVFYVSPSPNDPPFVRPGEIVREGDPIGLIEAMKVFSEILADRAGRVSAVVAGDGQLVQAGDPIVELTPLDRGE